MFRVFVTDRYYVCAVGLRPCAVLTVFHHSPHNKNCYFSDANYSIKHNINILLYSILQIDVCLRFQNLKKIENWFTNEGAIAISVRCVFNKNHSR